MSRQQTLFHHFTNGPMRNTSRKENGSVTLQPEKGSPEQKAINQDNLIENFDDDLLLAACENWEESTLSLPANDGDINDNAGSGHENAPGTVQKPFQQSIKRPVQQRIPQATQLEDLPGFDVSAGKIWIYPTNYPVREYQYNIVQQALFKNTMVSLPTGLGKTFVAAVIMYNFYRWYPEGRVVFMAPTKPLVAQQIEACHNVMGIQQSYMAEMTGNIPPVERKKEWHRRRVFFLTPQVLMNDLSRRACPSQLVKCLVVDEAHKALGNHAYCQVVRELSKYSSDFRVLALSATPGSDLKAIQQVLTNLLVSHIEIRSEDSIDIQRYVHERKVEKVVVPLDDELKSFRDRYLRILSLYVSRLNRCGALYNRDPSSLTKFQILQSRDAFRQDPPPQVKSRGVIEGDFALCISLYHGFELLLQHGLRSLYNFLQNTVDGAKGFSRTRQELMRNVEFVQLMDKLRDKFGGGEELGGGANRSHHFSSPGTPRVKEVKTYVTSHPKMARLQEIVLEHFRKFAVDKESPSNDKPSTSKQQLSPTSRSTRVMIFAQYRDSVNEIAEMLNRHHPLLRCMGFVGQASAGKTSKGISQKEQLRVVKEFREGSYNTLVCTCVGEEGLDIGDVDLIVCYDAHKSPIRLVQRMGRTGRKRQGRIVMLVTEGKEAAIYDRSQYSKKSIVKALQGNARSLQLYPNSPRMVPQGLNPAPHKMFISIEAFMNKEAKQKSSAGPRRNEAGIDTFMVKANSHNKTGGFLSPEELTYWSANYKLDAAESESLPAMPDRGRFVTLGPEKDKLPSRRKSNRPELSMTEWSPWQMNRQSIKFVEHSHRCHQFVELMEFIDLQNLMDGDDIYGLEMQTYLDEEDIIRPRKKGIEQFCTRVRRDTDSIHNDDLRMLPGRSKSKQSKSSVRDTKGEPSGETVSKERRRDRAMQRTRPVELMSSPSDSNRSDDKLPDVFQVENEDQVASEILNRRKTPTSAEKNGFRLDSRIKKEKSAEGNSVKAIKPRKHKQKRKHLKPVLDSSDDDDFTNNLKQDKTLGGRKAVSPGKEEDSLKTALSKKDSIEDKVNCSPNQKTTDVEYDTPQPMDTDSDTFVTLKYKKMSVPISYNNASVSLLNKTNDDLSFMFPTQSICFPPSANKDYQEISEVRPSTGKLVIPPPPPSLSSLDLLDDIDTTFNLTQHFQHEANYFGGLKEPSEHPSKSTSGEDSPEEEHKSELEKFQVSKTLDSNLQKSSENILPVTSTDNDGMVSDEESNTITNLSLTEITEEIQIKNNPHDNENNKPAALARIEPQFDLNVDFTIISSEDEAETAEDQNTDKGEQFGNKPNENPTDQDINDGEKIDYFCNDIMVSVMDSPQAFDVQTPQVESTLVETSSTSIHKSLSATSSFHGSAQLRENITSSKNFIGNRKSALETQCRNPKISSSGTPETPKSGREPGTKSRFAGRFRDVQKGLSCAEHQDIRSKRELDLKVQEPQQLNISTVQDDRNQVQQEEDSAEIERLRMEVLGSAEPKFDLGFDLDSLEEDNLEDDDVVPPSPNMEKLQGYINLSQVAIPKKQCSSASRGATSVWTRASSTPVSRTESKLGAVSCGDFVSPITTNKLEKDQNIVIDEHPLIVSMDQLEALSHTNNRKSTETVSVTDHDKTPRSLSRKSLKMQETTKTCTELSTSPIFSAKPLIVKDAIAHPLRENITSKTISKQRFNLNVRSTFVGKRKSSPIISLADDSPIGVKRRKSEPAGPTLNCNPLAGPDVGALCAKNAGLMRGSQHERASPESEVIVLDDDDDDEPFDNQGGKVLDCSKHYPIYSDDEDDALSQAVQHRKRRKAIALRSPQTPAFKTPVKPCIGSSNKKTIVKPVATSSDDDLESPLIRRPKKRRQILALTDVDDGDDNFIDENSNKKEVSQFARKVSSEHSQHPAMKEHRRDKHKKETKKTRFALGRARGFLEEEAEVSDGEGCSSDEEGSDLDNSLVGFINNASQLTQASQSDFTANDMHAVYMQSVRSPKGVGLLHPTRNRFKMVQSAVPDNLEIFSQVPIQDESYYENSFVVREGEEGVDDEVMDEKGWKQGRKDRFEESLLENTINPDNIITSRRRGRNQGMSRAEQILKEGRRRALIMSSSSTSTSTEETDEEWRGQDRKMQPRDKRKGQKGQSLGAPNSNENLNSTGWLSTGKGYQQVPSVKPVSVRNPVNNHQGSLKRTHVQQLSKVSEVREPADQGKSQALNKLHNQSESFPNQSQRSVIRQFVEVNRLCTNSCPEYFPNQKQGLESSRPKISTSEPNEVAKDGLTLAEKAKAERLRRQEEKKREFMRKMEERKRQQHQQIFQQTQELHQKVQQKHQHHKQQQQEQQHKLNQTREQQKYQKHQQFQQHQHEQQQQQQLKQTQQQPEHQQLEQPKHYQQQKEWQQQKEFRQTGKQQQLNEQQPQWLMQKAEQHCSRSSHSARQNAKEVQLINNHLQTPSSSMSLQKSDISTTSSRSNLTQKPTRMSVTSHLPPGNLSPGNQGIVQGTGRNRSPGKMQHRSPPVSPSSMQLMSKTTLAGSQEAMNRGKPVILIDSKELSSSTHIVSTLAIRHNLNPLVCQLSGCDYVVSARMGVEKKTMSDFGNGANKTKLIDRVRHLCELFDRPCLILEKDRVKPADDKKPRQLIRTKYFDSTLAALSKTHIKVLYSDSMEDTARILADLVRIEARKGEGLAPHPAMDPTQEQAFKLYLSLPRVSYATALSLLTTFPSVEQLINSSPEQLQQRAKISHQRSAAIFSFLHHQFDEQMTSLSASR